MSNNKIRFCKKLVRIFLKLAIVLSIIAVLAGSNIDLKQILETSSSICIGLSVVVDLIKDIEVDRFEEEWVNS